MGVKSGLFSGLGGFGGGVVQYGAVVSVQTKGEKNLGFLAKRLEKLNSGFLKFGVSTIFVDRLVQSFTRAMDTLNNVLGMTRITEAAEKFSRLSQFTGISTKNLQAFTAAASKVGAEADDVSDLFQTLTERVDDLRSGTEKGIEDDFKRFGMDKDTFSGANNGMKQFLVLMKSLDKLAPEKRMAALEKLLGGDLARKFGQLGDVKQITRDMQEAIAQGVVLTDQQIDQAKRLAGINRNIGRAFEGISNGLFFILEPALEAVGSRIEDNTSKMAKFLKAIGGDASAVVEQGIVPMLDKFEAIGISIETDLQKPLEEFLGRLALGLGIVAAAGAVATIAMSGVTATVIGIAVVVLALAVVMEDLFFFFQSGGKEGFLAKMVPQSKVLTQALEWASEAATIFGMAFEQLSLAANELLTGPIGMLLVGILGAIVALIAGIAAGLARLAYGLAVILRVIVRAVGYIIDRIVTLGQYLSFGGWFGGGTNSSAQAALVSNKDAALYGRRDTNTERFILGAAQGAQNLTNNQTNNINVNSSNPAAAVGPIQNATGRAMGSMAGGKP